MRMELSWRSAYKKLSASGNYHGQMNNQNFEKEKFLPNLPEKSVVIFDSAPYHHIKIYRLRMISWLEAGDQL
jgi:hypothetical protein